MQTTVMNNAVLYWHRSRTLPRVHLLITAVAVSCLFAEAPVSGGERADAPESAVAKSRLGSSPDLATVDLQVKQRPSAEKGGAAVVVIKITTYADIRDARVEVTVPQGLAPPDGFPKPIEAAAGQVQEHEVVVRVPPGDKRYDIIAQLRGFLNNVPCVQNNNVILTVGNPPEEKVVLTRSGGRLIREVRVDDRLRRNRQ